MKRKKEEEEETPGAQMARLLEERLAGKDTRLTKKKLEAATKKFFGRHGTHVTMTFGDDV